MVHERVPGSLGRRGDGGRGRLALVQVQMYSGFGLRAKMHNVTKEFLMERKGKGRGLGEKELNVSGSKNCIFFQA